MTKLEKFKKYVKEHKKEVIIGVITLTGVIIYIVVNENQKRELYTDLMKAKDDLKIANDDIDLLMDVMDGTVLDGQKSSELRQLRYAEGRLSNGLKDGTISEIDVKIRKEEIAFHSGNIARIDKASKRIRARRG